MEGVLCQLHMGLLAALCNESKLARTDSQQAHAAMWLQTILPNTVGISAFCLLAYVHPLTTRRLMSGAPLMGSLDCWIT
jgi:hypothetical protein